MLNSKSIIKDKINVGQEDTKEFNLNQMPKDFMLLPINEQELLYFIHGVEQCRETQLSIDNCYDKLKQLIDKNMKEIIPLFKNRSNKKYKISKPYWTNELHELWRDMANKEKKLHKCKLRTFYKNLYRIQFKESANKFEKALRHAKRNYNKTSMEKIEKLRTDNPTEFWRRIKRLDPKTKSYIPMEIESNSSDLVTDVN